MSADPRTRMGRRGSADAAISGEANGERPLAAPRRGQPWLADAVALLVGAGSGIGRAVVDAFLAEGARVAVLELDPSKSAALQQDRPEVAVTTGDATRFDDLAAAVAATTDAYGRIDTVATFVGVFDYYRALASIAPDTLGAAFDETFHTNVLSSMLAVRAAAESLGQSSNGNVVLTLSSSSFYPGRGGPLYVASKFALRGLVVQLAHELAPRVRVNGVAPGGTMDTDLRGLRSLGLDMRRLGAAPERERSLRDRTPLRVALRPADHAGAYVYLASERSRGVTGRVVRTDGGIGIRG